MDRVLNDSVGIEIKMVHSEEIFPLKCSKCEIVFRVQAFPGYNNYLEQVVSLCPYCGAKCNQMTKAEWKKSFGEE